jgi:hypothetical protein
MVVPSFPTHIALRWNLWSLVSLLLVHKGQNFLRSIVLNGDSCMLLCELLGAYRSLRNLRKYRALLDLLHLLIIHHIM